MYKGLVYGSVAVPLIATSVFVFWLVWFPNMPTPTENQMLRIPRESTFSDVVDSLERRNLIQYSWPLQFLGQTTGWADQIKAGHYVFFSSHSNYSLLQILRKGLQTPVSVRIPAGSRLDRIASSAAANMAFESDDFLAALRDSTLAASLNTDTLHLFSYMLPETYQFYWLTEAEDVIRRIKGEFDQFYERELISEAQRRNLTRDEVVSLAAIVEWETHLNEEKSRIAGVYLNRLRDRWPLQADPTVQYALIEREGNVRRLFYRDYRISHPYNTYLFQGLPTWSHHKPFPLIPQGYRSSRRA